MRRQRLNTPNKPSFEKPDWIKVRLSTDDAEFQNTQKLVRENNLHTVCEEAACPNIGSCWKQKHATIMIMGDTCTRSCRFCNVKTGKPKELDPFEPFNAGKLAATLGLSHMVITSVDRDDLADGGAEHFVKCIQHVRTMSPNTTIEVLTPDFRHKDGALNTVIKAVPDVFNHNLETVPRLYRDIRPKARYFHSLNILWQAKQLNKEIFTKSGIMVGLGETKEEVLQVMDDLYSANVDFLTIGQYLQPTPFHAPIDRFITPDEFEEYKTIALRKGFLMVSSGPLVRSSYHADKDFVLLKQKRIDLNTTNNLITSNLTI